MGLSDALAAAASAVEGESELSLVVGQSRGTPPAFEFHAVRLSSDIATDFREIARTWLAGLQDHTVVPYEAMTELDSNEVFLIEDPETLAELQDLSGLVNVAVELPELPASGLDHKLGLYGVVAGDDDRVVFMKRSDPQVGHSRSRGLIASFRARLERLTAPTFAFYDRFDFALSSSWALVVQQSAFEKAFRDAGLVEQHVDEWVDVVASSLPWAAGAVDELRVAARGDSRMWRRLRDIHRRGHLAAVTIDQVKEYAEEVGLDAADLVVNDELVFEQADKFKLLQLLNEDLFRGPLTGETFEAHRKGRVE